MAIVIRDNKEDNGIGENISTSAAAATIDEAGYNHFVKTENEKQGGDLICFQGHASPGLYTKAFFEGCLSDFDLGNFRREFDKEVGLPSHSHPTLSKILIEAVKDFLYGIINS